MHKANTVDRSKVFHNHEPQTTALTWTALPPPPPPPPPSNNKDNYHLPTHNNPNYKPPTQPTSNNKK